MQKIYTTKNRTVQEAEDINMKKPRMSTINFLRNFARAYSYSPNAGTLVLN